VYKHPSRRVIFLGDYLDRGPDARSVVRLVRSMVEAGEAEALIGNHELNTLCFWTPKESGGYLRDHSINKILIHTETLALTSIMMPSFLRCSNFSIRCLSILKRISSELNTLALIRL
jgi:hypothetical protein